MESLSIKEIEAACNGQFFGDDDIYHQSTTAIKIDSRIIQKGDVFIAVIGENMDGHHFIDSALDKGALLAITQKPMQKRSAKQKQNEPPNEWDYPVTHRRRF